MIAVPVYNMILTPDANVYFGTDQIRRSAGDKGIALGERVVLLVAKENENYADMTSESFYPIGQAGVIKEINQQGYVVIHTDYRVDIENVEIAYDHTIRLSMSRRSDIDDMSAAVEAEKLKNLIQEMRKFASGFEWGDSAEYWMKQVDSIGMAACAMSPWLEIENERRYAILAEDSKLRRAEMIEEILYGFLEVGRITNEAVTSQQEEHQRMYREQAIKRQMEHLQRELDEMHPENITDIRKFEQKIEESGMNETARKEADKVLNRLKQEGSQSAEAGLLYDYLDFITGLSWKKESQCSDCKSAGRQAFPKLVLDNSFRRGYNHSC